MKAKSEGLITRDWFSKTLLTMGEAVITTDLEGNVTSMNKIAEKLTGWSFSESIGKHVDRIWNAIDDQTLLQKENPVYQAILYDKRIMMSNHTVLLARDNSQRFIVDSAVPIHDDSDKIIGCALIFRDVTELSLSKNKLFENEGLLKGIMDNTSQIIYIKDLKGNYRLINKKKEEIYTIKSKELIGKATMSHLTKAEGRESKRLHLEVINKKQLVEFEQVIRHPDLTVHAYHTLKFPLFDSEKRVYAVCSISTDISESKKNIEMKEELLRQKEYQKSEVRYEELIRNMPNLFFSMDKNLRHTSFNRAIEKFTQKKAEDVIGKTMSEVFPKESYMRLSEYKEVIRTGVTQNFIRTFKIKNAEFTFMINIYPTEKGISVLMTDLTAQKKSETETLELVDRLQRKNKDLRQFAYTVSHDLRAPIARVLGLVSLSNIDPDYKIFDKTILQNVSDEIGNLDNVVKDMNSAIAASDEGKQREYVTFETQLELIKKVLENQIADSKVAITFDFKEAEGLFTVKSYLYSIMYNLLSNAIKYRLPETPLTIHFQTGIKRDILYLSVKDNGMGIDLDKFGEKIFGLYSRFHGSKIEGKGIGLHLVKVQAESLGGSVEIESKVNQGSKFIVRLPINPKENEID